MGRLSLRRQLQRRRWYADTKSWLLDGYLRLLNRVRCLPLPRRAAGVTLQFKGMRRPLFFRPVDMWLAQEVGGSVYAEVVGVAPRGAGKILDLGGNIGATVRLWQEYFPEAEITVVEPDDGNLAQLRKNVALGPAPEKVTVVRAFAAAEAGEAAIDRSSGVPGSYRMARGDAGGAERVGKMAVADLVGAAVGRDGRIDLLKVDVEGAEAEIFRDCRGWIHRISAMVVDLHDSYTPAALLADLDRAGAGYSHSVRGGGPWLVFVKFRGQSVAGEAG